MIHFRPARFWSYRAAACVSFVSLLGLGTLFADPHDTTWCNGAKDSNWSTAGNWQDNAVPDDGAIVHLTGNSTEAAPIKYSTGNGIRNLIFDSGYLEITAGSLPISIGATIGNSSTDSAQVTIDANATLGRSDVELDLGTVDKATAMVNLHGGTLTGAITVGANPTATATVKGYGTISGINQGSTFTLKGQIIASGGTLTLSNLNALFATAQNSDGNAGWYAVSGGKIITPDATASDTPLPTGPTGEGVWVWGDQAADGSALTMVNIVAIRYKASDPTVLHGLSVRLLANDNSGAHPAPAGTAFIGYWNVATAQGSTDLTLTGLSFRYDHTLAQGGDPTLYFWNGTAWDKLPSKITKPTFVCYYAGSDALKLGDYALGIGAAPGPGQK